MSARRFMRSVGKPRGEGAAQEIVEGGDSIEEVVAEPASEVVEGGGEGDGAEEPSSVDLDVGEMSDLFSAAVEEVAEEAMAEPDPAPELDESEINAAADEALEFVVPTFIQILPIALIELTLVTAVDAAFAHADTTR